MGKFAGSWLLPKETKTGVCTWCNFEGKVTIFAVQLEPHRIQLCRECELLGRKAGNSAFHLDFKWLETIVKIRKKHM